MRARACWPNVAQTVVVVIVVVVVAVFVDLLRRYCCFLKSVTDKHTDKHTNGSGYRVAPQLKIQFIGLVLHFHGTLALQGRAGVDVGELLVDFAHQGEAGGHIHGGDGIVDHLFRGVIDALCALSELFLALLFFVFLRNFLQYLVRFFHFCGRTNAQTDKRTDKCTS